MTGVWVVGSDTVVGYYGTMGPAAYFGVIVTVGYYFYVCMCYYCVCVSYLSVVSYFYLSLF